MGGKKLCKIVERLLKRYPKSVLHEDPCKQLNPSFRPKTYIIDIMEFIRGKPRRINTLDEFASYLMGKIRNVLLDCNSTYTTYVLLVDIGAPETKKLHTHVVRKCKTSPEDENKKDEDDEDNHIVLNDKNYKLPSNWHKYNDNKARVRRELYPFILRTLTDPSIFTLPPGYTIIFSGLPFCTDTRKTLYDNKLYNNIYLCPCAITEEMEKLDPSLYHRGGLVRWMYDNKGRLIPICLHIPEYDNDILEADLKVPFFIKKMSEHVITVRTNDRDFIPICLAASIDRHYRGTFDNHLYLQIPNKSKNRSPLDPPNRYIVINDLFMLITNDSQLANVYNKPMTLIFIIILVGCDHTRKDFLHGISVESVLETLIGAPRLYGHMVQLSNLLVRDPNAIRVPVVDERAAIEFVTHVYITQYTKSIQLKRDKEYKIKMKAWIKGKKEGPIPVRDSSMIDRGDIRQKLKRANNKNLLPTRMETRKDIRYVTHTLYYYLNASRDSSLFAPGGRFDILKVAQDGLSYWGYEKYKNESRIAAYVSPIQDLRHIPMCYINHMIKSRSTSMEVDYDKIQQTRKRERSITVKEFENEISLTKRNKIKEINN